MLLVPLDRNDFVEEMIERSLFSDQLGEKRPAIPMIKDIADVEDDGPEARLL